MDEYQQTIWNALDNYHKRLWAGTVGMHGPWNDYTLIKYEDPIYATNSIAYLSNLNDEDKDKKRLEAIIKKADKIEDYEQREQALEKTITRRVRKVAKRLYLEESEMLDHFKDIGGRYPGQYFEEQAVESLKRKWKDR